MKIDKNKYYSIIKKEADGTTTIFNNRVYLGRYVMLAYNQIPNKEKYKIATLIALEVKNVWWRLRLYILLDVFHVNDCTILYIKRRNYET